MSEELNSGDKVVVFAAAARSAAISAGAVSGAIAMWIARREAGLSGIGFLGGAALGWLLGTIVGKVLFPAPGGNMLVARAGSASLPTMLKGNLSASLVTGLLMACLVVLVTKADFWAVAPSSIGVAVLIGVVFALLASLT